MYNKGSESITCEARMMVKTQRNKNNRNHNN